MDAETVMRAWKDEGFAATLSDEQRAAIPPRPEHFEQLTDEQLQAAAGGTIDELVDFGQDVVDFIGWGASIGAIER